MRERDDEPSDGFDAATIIVEPCEEIEPASVVDNEKIEEAKSLGKREEFESENDGFTDEVERGGISRDSEDADSAAEIDG